MEHLSKADEIEFERCFYLMSGGRNMSKVKNPREVLAKIIQEMGKDDIDYFYPHIIKQI